MSDEKDLPGIPSTVDSALRRPLEAMRESIQRLMGMRGADGRAAVRWDDLADEGLASLPRRRLLIKQAIEQGGTGSGSGTGGGTYVPDLTKPPAPTGLSGEGAITSILLTWAAPTYTVGHGHKQTNVYATKQPFSSSTLYTINDAVRVNTAPGAQTVLAHTSDPNIKWRIWIKFESVDGVESDPAGGVNGLVVSTGQDVAHLLEVLTGQIANSQLASALSTKIALIDAPAATAGSVDARIKTETDARVSGDSTTLSSAQSYTASYAYSKSQTNAQISTYAYSKAATDTAIATSTATVSARLNAGGDVYSSIATAQSTASAKNANFKQGTAPSATKSGDTWIDTANGNILKVWSGSAWVASDDTRIGTAASNITTLQSQVVQQRRWENQVLVNGNDAALIGAVLMESDGVTPFKNADALIPASSSKGALVYTVSARVHGTSTATGAVSTFTVAWNGSAWVWTQTVISEAGSSSNHVKLYLNGGVPSVRLYSHTASYLVAYSVSVDVAGYSAAAAVQVEQSTRASETGHLGALYTVRTQLTAGGKTVIGGFGLSGTSAPGAGATIDFGVSADKFWVGAPSGSTGVGDIKPFVVQTTDQTVNGVLIPKGVYMDAAYIKNLTAMLARLGAAWVDNAMIANLSADKLTAGDGTIGGDLKSTNYVAGSAGWRVRPDGSAEFSNIVIRGATYTGTIYATAGTIGGITIAATYMRAGQIGFDNGTGFYFGSDGRFSFGNSSGSKITWDNSTLNISANLVGATGSFAGSLSAATGTFAGSMTASAVNAVNTINIAGYAVTVSVAGESVSYDAYVTISVSNSGEGQYVLMATFTQGLYKDAGDTWYLQVSISGGAWTTVQSEHPSSGTIGSITRKYNFPVGTHGARIWCDRWFGDAGCAIVALGCKR